MDLCELTEILWKKYISPDPADQASVLEYLAPDCVIIGTGAHEFYTELPAFAQAIQNEITERENVVFQCRGFQCEERPLTPDISLVYGTLHIWWESEDGQVCINMNSRFSIIFRKIDGSWKCVHIHQSLPNQDQLPGEYFPKKLSEQLKEAKEKVCEMTLLAQNDSLTGLTNFHTFESLWKSWDREDTWLFLLDLDDFKNINDCFGHVTGNHVLKRVAHILAGSVRSHDIACRMGGDEFMLLCSGLKDEESARHLADRILKNMKSSQNDLECWPGISIGGTPVVRGEGLESAMTRADEALYFIKKAQKNSYHFYPAPAKKEPEA